MSTIVGESRRSQLVGTFGVGSMFPAPEQSLMICGLDDWASGDHQTVSEQRLAQSLGVSRLVTPRAGGKYGDVPVVRFPRWYFCPDCRRLAPWHSFDTTRRNPRCQLCERDAVPSRFIVACTQSHIDDFPYSRWTHVDRPVDEDHRRTYQLKLFTRGETSSLADVEVQCGCGASRTMEGSFSPKALLGVSGCTGSRPWLPGTPPHDSCSETPRVLQRGSSSVWFSDVRSAISIPPWSDIHHKIQGSWGMFKDADETLLRGLFKLPGWIPEGSHWTVDQLVQAVQELRDGPPADDEALRRQEYKALITGHSETNPSDQFVCERVDLSATSIHPFVDEARDVSRLREVTALVSFSRLVPPGTPGATAAELSSSPVDWLPAVEVFGEGIFVALNEHRLQQWETSDFASLRTVSIAQHAGEDDPVSPRRLLVHSFAHALMNELSMDAGYPVASLRERVYAGKDHAGVLIYTASADSAGSLGGLSAQSEPGRLDAVLHSAMQRALWCTADPVCIESTASGINNLNLAACHACMLVPEISCEKRNCFLDRALLVGLPDRPEVGYFSELLAM